MLAEYLEEAPPALEMVAAEVTEQLGAAVIDVIRDGIALDGAYPAQAADVIGRRQPQPLGDAAGATDGLDVDDPLLHREALARGRVEPVAEIARDIDGHHAVLGGLGDHRSDPAAAHHPSFLGQHADGLANGDVADLEGFFQLGGGRNPITGMIIPIADAAPEGVRDLTVKGDHLCPIHVAHSPINSTRLIRSISIRTYQ